MESLYLLIPLSVVLVLLIGAVLAWAALSGQFENLDAEGSRILADEDGTPAAEPPRERLTSVNDRAPR
jgi:cbb3-type cytochrome oxidase maturation protein